MSQEQFHMCQKLDIEVILKMFTFILLSCIFLIFSSEAIFFSLVQQPMNMTFLLYFGQHWASISSGKYLVQQSTGVQGCKKYVVSDDIQPRAVTTESDQNIYCCCYCLRLYFSHMFIYLNPRNYQFINANIRMFFFILCNLRLFHK